MDESKLNEALTLCQNPAINRGVTKKGVSRLAFLKTLPQENGHANNWEKARATIQKSCEELKTLKIRASHVTNNDVSRINKELDGHIESLNDLIASVQNRAANYGVENNAQQATFLGGKGRKSRKGRKGRKSRKSRKSPR